MRFALAACAATLALCGPAYAAGAPNVDTLKSALEKQLLALKPDGMSERQVLFQSVATGKPNGGYYPFMVTVLVRDYGPGYPANRYYGQTCVGRLEGEKFDLVDDGFGGWRAQGRMTPRVSECKDNPAAGISATPLASLAGAQASKTAAPVVPPAAGASGLYLGEYACYGTGSRLMAGMGFKLAPGGRYADVDGKRGGAYVYNAGAATLSFNGGFLGGQTGKHVTNRGFDISATVNCEPWR